MSFIEQIKFCSHCGNKISFGDIPGDELQRYFCKSCQTIHYQNPKIIVGCLPRWQDKVLLCKRAISPRKGLWTLPSGYLENGEDIEHGAKRETEEEANAEVEIVRLYSVYSIPHIGQVYLQFLADLNNLDFHPGAESLEVKLFRKEEIPWEQIAFAAIKFTLEKYCNTQHLNCEVHIGTSNTQ